MGVQAARQFKARCSNSVEVIELGTAGLSLLDFVEGFDRLVIIDAILTGAAPGTVHELTGEEVAKTVHLGVGHEADLPTAIALGQKLSRHMPAEVVVVAVEAADITTFSEELTPQVASAIQEVLARVGKIVGF